MNSINILGYGLMGKQIASFFYLGGFAVNIWNDVAMNEADLARQIKLTGKNIPALGQGKINYCYDADSLPESVTIEAVIEDLAVKQDLYKRITGRFSAPYFTNSSSFSPPEIGTTVNGLHFFNPITMGLVELYLSQKEIEHQIQPVLDVLRYFKFEIVTVLPNRGYIGNYLLFREISNFLKLIEEGGYSLEAVGRAYAKLYAGRDIIKIIDIVGLDVVYKILINLKSEDNTIYIPKCLETALAGNILGRKNKTSIEQVLR